MQTFLKTITTCLKQNASSSLNICFVGILWQVYNEKHGYTLFKSYRIVLSANTTLMSGIVLASNLEIVAKIMNFPFFLSNIRHTNPLLIITL